MEPTNKQSEIIALQVQLQGMNERFDHSLHNKADLSETKKLFHELRKLQERLDTLTQQNVDI